MRPDRKRHQMHGDRRRADVAGNPVGFVLQAGIEPDDEGARGIHVAMDRRGDAPLALAQDLLDFRDDVRGDQQVLPAPVLLQHRLQPVEVAQRLVHVRLIDLDIAQLDRRIALDDAVGGRLAHHLGVDHRILRHVDDEIALDGGRAGETTPFRQAAHALVAFLLGALGRDMAERGHDLVLGEAAFLHLHLTAAAGRAAAAHALHIDAERPRRVEHRRADGKPPALAGRHEQDQRVLDVDGRVQIGHAYPRASLASRPPRRRPPAAASPGALTCTGAGAACSPGL